MNRGPFKRHDVLHDRGWKYEKALRKPLSKANRRRFLHRMRKADAKLNLLVDANI